VKVENARTIKKYIFKKQTELLGGAFKVFKSFGEFSKAFLSFYLKKKLAYFNESFLSECIFFLNMFASLRALKILK
jgi:hypothetical protein